MIRRWLRCAGLVCCLLPAFAALSESYEVDVHQALSDKVVDRSQTLDNVLRDELGFPDGREQPFVGLSARFWIPRGSIVEDLPGPRVFNHFHNPLLPAGQAGLRSDLFGVTVAAGQSSVLWQQNPAQPTSPVTFLNFAIESGGEDRPWQRARRDYLQALIGETIGERNGGFRETFLGLGHIMHVIQDATVPAHVRNDPHPTLTVRLAQPDERRFPIDSDPYEDWVMSTLRLRRSVFDALADATPPGGMPDLSTFGFAGTPVAGAPVPIARLIDTTVYRQTLSADMLVDTAMTGIAEYTNGNYLSKDTIFRRFTHPAVSSLGPRAEDLLVPEPGGGFRQYFAKETAGAPVRPFVMEGALHQSLQAATGLPPGFGGWFLDDRIQEAYASKLLPRAIAYSTALVDYFFRGRFDVDFTEDSETSMRLSGSLVSTETANDFRLDGTVAVYEENAEGRRTLLAPPTPIAGTTSELPEISVPRSEAATKFVAVYQGTLGQEERTATGSFIGAVVGKVFEQPRIEEVFAADGRWHLRTPAGIFPLPITGEIEDLRWGDVDNTLVGRTALGPGAPNTFRAYRISRPVGSSQIPMRVEGSGTVVDVSPILPDPAILNPDRELPDGLPLGSVVHFIGRHEFAHDLLTFTGRQQIFYDPTFPAQTDTDGYFTWPILTDSLGVFEEAGPMTVEAKARETVALDLTFPIQLDRARYDSPAASRYSWKVREIGLDPLGRMLAVVEVTLTEPENNSRLVPIEIKNRGTGQPEILFVRFVSVHFPVRTLLFALVDVTSGTVLASTATAQVTLTTDFVNTLYTLQKGMTDHVNTGPLAGQTITLWEFAGVIAATEPDSLPPGPAPTLTASHTTVDGQRVLSLSGWYRPEIRTQVYSHVGIDTLTGSTPWVYAFVKPQDAPEVTAYLAYTQNFTAFSQTGYVTYLRDAQRQRPGAAAQQVLLFRRPIGISLGDEGVLVNWTPATAQTPAQAVRALPGELPVADSHRLAGATSKRALVISGDTSRLVDLERQTAQEFFGDDLSNRFVLLDPAFVYHVQDLRFHRPTPPTLRRTALPAKLVTVDGNPVHDYHLIRSP